jgi:hypothetical protein
MSVINRVNTIIFRIRLGESLREENMESLEATEASSKGYY